MSAAALPHKLWVSCTFVKASDKPATRSLYALRGESSRDGGVSGVL